MSNVVSLRHARPRGVDPAVPALIDLLALRRRNRHDPFWLKENAELVQILAATQHADCDLAPIESLLSSLMSELRFFPQYYRLYLSLAVDMATLGVQGLPLDEMVDFVLSQRLMDVELSDTHRGEARLLMRRAGADLPEDPALDARLFHFSQNARGFCLPNRRAAYDLTHIVFHGSDYGRLNIATDPLRDQSLMHAGMVAWLEDNLDLLSEVVIAQVLSGATPPDLWVREIRKFASAVEFSAGHEGARFDDDYHQYLVSNWAVSVLGGSAFDGHIPASARLIHQRRTTGHALRELSLILLDMGDARTGDWARMSWRIRGRLSEPSRQRLEAIEPLPEFEGFFEGFARAATIAEGA